MIYKAELERFWSKVDKSTDCWLWAAGTFCDGYGQFWTKQKGSVRAHRYSWVLSNGPILNGLHVLHKCDNPLCVNPDHLWLGTEKDNAMDRESKGRGAYAKGYVQSDASRLKRSQSLMGNKSRTGMPHTEETKLKMSLTASKRPKDEKGRWCCA